MQLDVRPSPFSACNIKKPGGAWEQGYPHIMWVGALLIESENYSFGLGGTFDREVPYLGRLQ